MPRVQQDPLVRVMQVFEDAPLDKAELALELIKARLTARRHKATASTPAKPIKAKEKPRARATRMKAAPSEVELAAMAGG